MVIRRSGFDCAASAGRRSASPHNRQSRRSAHAPARRPPYGSWIELSATLDFMLATLVGNGAAWSVATLLAIKGQLAPFRRLAKVPCWHRTDMPALLSDVRCRSQSRRPLLVASISPFGRKADMPSQPDDVRSPAGTKQTSRRKAATSFLTRFGHGNLHRRRERYWLVPLVAATKVRIE
jgi:hypothetical protein